MIRLARGGRKLTQDGAWHPFGDDGRTYYRVVRKVMQRVRLEEGEAPELYRLFDTIDPLPSRTAKEGFREEMRIVIEDDHYRLGNLLLRAYLGWELLADAVRVYNGDLEYRAANVLEFSYAIPEFTRNEFRKGLLLSKAVSVVGPQLADDSRMGIPHIPSEVKGLLHAAYTILLEETATDAEKSAKKPKNDESQASLF